MNALVIVNPLAGGRRITHFDRVRTERVVNEAAARAGMQAELFVTTGPHVAYDRARRAVDAGASLVVAWGGDGTVNEVAAALAGSLVPLGIVPGGSGNGLARELRLPWDPSRALAVAFARQSTSIDVGRLGDRLFVNVAGTGFDAHVAQCFSEGGRKRGVSRYVYVTVRELLRYEPQRYHVRWRGASFEGTAAVVAIANSRQYGNGARVAPAARLDDGELDLVIIEPTRTLADLWRMRRLFTGSILQDAHVRSARVREVTIETGLPVPWHVDGEPIAGPRHAEITVWPRALSVCRAGESS